ncbi:MAG: hypothetical protein KAR42_15405 [candidate division Zixibacteria bacterium]|nr:hypothetical protein [candidate division Zixibacteria bacterium]
MSFIEIPLTNTKGLLHRKLFGVGVNDSTYRVKNKVDGKTIHCPYYSHWKAMMERCYYEKYQGKHPAYKGCSVVTEWHIFSNFRKWMEDQDWHGKHLDKDIMEIGNRVYSPDKCVFVTRKLNNLVQGRMANKTGLPVGVRPVTRNSKYSAKNVFNGKITHLGVFNTPEGAHQAYLKARVIDLYQTSNEQTDLRIRDGVLNRALKLNRSIR